MQPLSRTGHILLFGDHDKVTKVAKFHREALIKSHSDRCGKNGPQARRLGGRIPAVGCNREANKASGLLSAQPFGL